MKDCLHNTKEYFGEHQIPWQMHVARRIYFLLLVAKIASVAFCYLMLLEEKVIGKWFTSSNCIPQLTYFHKCVQKFNLDLCIGLNSINISIFTNLVKMWLPSIQVEMNLELLYPDIRIFFPLMLTHWQNRQLCRDSNLSGYMPTSVFLNSGLCLEFD